METHIGLFSSADNHPQNPAVASLPNHIVTMSHFYYSQILCAASLVSRARITHGHGTLPDLIETAE